MNLSKRIAIMAAHVSDSSTSKGSTDCIPSNAAAMVEL